ncbi:MAG: cytosine-specific methyltransferase [Nitrospirales bacterium]|nr:MAG: cytosine-specific methyltransferase [Nitrospirales bacterium]
MDQGQKNIIDLFCGCGGFSLGAHLAGFNTVLAVDIDPILSSAFAVNFPHSKLTHFDLAKTSGKEILEASGNQKIFGITGGPPCQGFSTMGRRDNNDPRNKLIGHFLEQVKDIEPSFFVMENVPGLISGMMREKLEKQMKTISEHYSVIGPTMVNASGLGAATKRQRVIVIGYNPREFKAFTEKDILALHSQELTSVRDAIGDLPPPLDCEEGDYGWTKYDGRRRMSEYARNAREIPSNGCGWDMAIEKLKQGHVSGLMNTVHSKEIMKRYASLYPGSTDSISKSYKLDWEGQCPTLRAGTGSDRGSFQAVRPIHPDQGRVITVREAARLQGFPDWFVFHPTKWHSFRMIGNSVSPHLAKKILKFIRGRNNNSLLDVA